MPYDLSGKVALITGVVSKRGIGWAIARRLARDGADIAGVDIYRTDPRSSEEDKIEGWRGLDSVLEEIEALGRRGLVIVADINKSNQLKEMVSQTLAKFGKIDILVNNAGITGPRRPALELDEEAWRRVLDVNLTGTFLCSQIVARIMVERGEGGKIINISSMVGKVVGAESVAYSATKAGLIMLTQVLARELAPYKINVNCICPGGTATELGRGRSVRSEARKFGISIEDATNRVYQKVIGAIPLGRMSQPEDQADAVAFLASKESDYITGVALNVTGGLVMVP